MGTLKLGSGTVSQLDAGVSVLASARTVETRLIKPRLTAFERSQRLLSAAHDKVVEAEAALTAAQTQLGELDVAQDEKVDALARALINDGEPLTNAFSAFGSLTPRALMTLAVRDEAKAIHQLVAAVQHAKDVSRPVLQAAAAADAAARAVDQQLTRVQELQASIRDARQARRAAAKIWAKDLAALKRGARAAADDGAPHLYATLFDRPGRSNGKSAKPAAAPTPAPALQPASAPAAPAAS